jgi:hypothetical protein
MHWGRITVISTLLALTGAAALAAPFGAELIRSALKHPPKPGPISHYPMAFKHLGFGDLNTCTSTRYPMIERTPHGRATAFLVKASVPCGLEVRNPSHYVQDGVVHLSYEAHFTGNVDMCNCEYRSVFSLADLPPSLTKVEFSERFVDSAP